MANVLPRDFAISLHRCIVAAIIAIHATMLAWISIVNSPALDEAGHISAGLSHWQLANFDLYRVNPPLPRMICATPLLFTSPNTDWSLISSNPFARSEFDVGKRFVEINSDKIMWSFTFCRWAQIPVSILGAWICYLWARELYGTSAGLLSLSLWCFCPNVLAWGAAITPDLGSAVFGLAATYSFWHWLKSPAWPAAALAGLTLGLAELSKTTWIILLALWPILWIAWRFVISSKPSFISSAQQLLSALLLALLVINLGYGFEECFQPLGRFMFVSNALKGDSPDDEAGNCFRDTWLESVPVPLPANYIKGIDVQKGDFERGKWAYLLGVHQFRGWHHYYIYGFFVKTPLGALLLFAIALVLILHRSHFSFMDSFILLAHAVTVIVLLSNQVGINRHIRYLLPALPFVYICASQAASLFSSRHFALRFACWLCVLAAVTESLLVFPHSMSFFNLAAGGPRGGPQHLLDSNIDWGQDLFELKRFVHHHPECAPLWISYFGSIDPETVGITAQRVPLLYENGKWIHLHSLNPGWYAISVNHLYGYHFEGPHSPNLSCFQRFTPDAMAGYSIYIYHITPDKIDSLTRNNTPTVE